MTRFTERVERDLGRIADRATPSSTAWDAIQQRIDEQDTTETTLEVIMLSPDRNQLPERRRTGLLVAASVAAIALIGGLIAVANRDDVQPADLPLPTVPATAPVTVPVIESTAPPITTTRVEGDPISDSDPRKTPSDDEVANAPLGPDFWGQNEFNPVPFGYIAHIGAGYRLQVRSVTQDATEEVLARFDFIDPPPDGMRYTLVSLAGGYYGLEDPQESFLAAVRAYRDNGEEIDVFDGCGAFPQFPDVGNARAGVNIFAGGVQRGELCLLTTPAESEGLLLQAFGGSGSENAFFEATEELTPQGELPTLTGIQAGTTSEDARRNPTPIGTPAEVIDTGWTITLSGPARDITDAIVDSDSSNPGPPDGFRFVGVPVRMEHGENSDKAPSGANARAVGDSNVEYGTECGVVPNALDKFTPVATGASVQGQLCFVVPAEEVDSIMVYAGRTTADVFLATQ
jgi:hypothetical protein